MSLPYILNGNRGGYIPMVIEENEDIKPRRLFNIYGEKYGTGFAGNVWDKNIISPNLMTM